MADSRFKPAALFHAVQLARLFEDSKTFADGVPLLPMEHIDAEFRALLREFAQKHFALPQPVGALVAVPEEGIPVRPLAEHIDAHWVALTRAADPTEAPDSSLIPLPHAYVVPGGRFREIYYWDSYFTMEGLAASGRVDLVDSMVRNFAWQIDSYGHVPNGNRRYFLSRSQPPMFACMLGILERARGLDAIAPFLPQLEREYQYWMTHPGAADEGRTLPYRRAVRLADGTLLNRYWDERNTPREEAFAEDMELHAQAAPEGQARLYRDIRAACESGWDFSSRWCGEDSRLESIRTTELLPVDLNCLLYRVERRLADWLGQLGEARAADYAAAAERRREAIVARCWDEEQGWFFDYAWSEGRRSDCWSLAGVFPLYCGLAEPAQARRVAEHIEARFLRPGGVVTTLTDSDQQWDSPNGWAPLQWTTVQGLRAYGFDALAQEIARRFVDLANRVYQRTGKLMEKYNVCDMSLVAGGGEYPVQDGFGWTNGVLRGFIAAFGLSGDRSPAGPAAEASAPPEVPVAASTAGPLPAVPLPPEGG